MTGTPRDRFLSFVRDHRSARPVCSPFLPHGSVVRNTLAHLGLTPGEDDIRNEALLARHLDYEPMFMTELTGLIFDWKYQGERSDAEWEIATIDTPIGEWVRRRRRGHDQWNDEAGCPIETESDHRYFVSVCEQVGDREEVIRDYYRDFRRRAGDDGVIVIGHPHPSWLGFQISPSNLFYHWQDFPATFTRSMEALVEAALFVMGVAVEEGLDFMSDSSYGLEMTSPNLFERMDLPYINRFADWTHDRGGLFWYHNCGHTRKLIMDGYFDRLGADVIETIAPPPEGDNDLAESRKYIDSGICTKGNLSLGLLRDGSQSEVIAQTERIVDIVAGQKHIYSTADGVLEGTPPENYIAFIQTVRRLTS